MPMLRRPDAEIYYEAYGRAIPSCCSRRAGCARASRCGTARRRPAAAVEMDESLADSYRVIAMDQRNAGKSVADVEADHGWHTFAADHLALMDHLGFGKFHVMGGCIGGSYCFEAIEQTPERVAAAVLQNPIGLWENRDTWDAAVEGLQRDGATAAIRRSARRPSSRSAATCSGGDFVFSVTRDFVQELPHAALPAARHRQAASGGHVGRAGATVAGHRGAGELARPRASRRTIAPRAGLPRPAHAEGNAEGSIRETAMAIIVGTGEHRYEVSRTGAGCRTAGTMARSPRSAWTARTTSTSSPAASTR